MLPFSYSYISEAILFPCFFSGVSNSVQGRETHRNSVGITSIKRSVSRLPDSSTTSSVQASDPQILCHVFVSLTDLTSTSG